MPQNHDSKSTKQPAASCLLTFRGSSPQRCQNLVYVAQQLVEMDNLEVIVIEQDVKPSPVRHQLPGNCRHRFVFNDQLFNKSWGLNIAASLARGNTLIVHDADMLVDAQSLNKAINQDSACFNLIKPYDTLIDLDPEESSYLIAGGTNLSITRSKSGINRIAKQEHPPVCGGVFVISRELFFAAGGMDERFCGWGGEDDAMSYRVQNQARLKTCSDTIAFHLWHEQVAPPGYDNPVNIANLAILSAYQEIGLPLLTGFKNDTTKNANTHKFTKRPSPVSNSGLPLISCLCVTRNRVEMLKRAIGCFTRQTHANKELIIICESDDASTIEFLQTLSDRNIHFHIIDSSTAMALGDLRNAALKCAHGEYFCQWDDDDYYHPARLSRQLWFAQSHHKAASILPRWTIYSQRNQQAYVSNIRLWEGSILCRRDFMNQQIQYLSISRGEESRLIQALIVADEIAIVDCPQLYVYCHSGSNTWDDEHFASIFRASTALSIEQTNKLRSLLDSPALINQDPRIPKTIHQTHFLISGELPAGLKNLHRVLIKAHPEWEYNYYTDELCRQLISDSMPGLVNLYDKLQTGAQRADLFRLVVVYVKGGFYLDIDIEILNPLDELTRFSCVFAEELTLDAQQAAELGHEHRLRIANYMFGAEPGNEFIGNLIKQLVSSSNLFDMQTEDDVLDSTGPGMVTRVYHTCPDQDKVTLIKNHEIICPTCQRVSCHLGNFARHHHFGSWRWEPLTGQSKTIHQTWKTQAVPDPFLDLTHSWQTNHPGWKYRLWTDQDNRDLIQSEFPWFLETYDAYPYAIQRVDAARYFILYRYGGLYVDMDFQCLKPVTSLLQSAELVLGYEHPLHSRIHNQDDIIGNAFIFAKSPGHDFLKKIIDSLQSRAQIEEADKNTYVLKSTGPFMITQLYGGFEHKQTIKLVPHEFLYPLASTQASGFLENRELLQNNDRHPEAFAVHYHAGSWWNGDYK